MSTSPREAVPTWGWMLGVSSWLVPVFFGPGFAWIGFLIVGAVSRRRAAFIAGIASGALGFTVAIELWGGFSAVVGAVVHLAGIVVALALNPAWLRTLWERRVARTSKARPAAWRRAEEPVAASARPSRRSRRGSKRASKPAPQPQQNRLADAVGATSADLLQTSEPAEPVDVQTASADEIAELPGMNRTKARRAVRARTTQGGFVSVEQFGEAAGLQPHEIVRLRTAATCSPRPRGERRFGRRVDI
ncbi:helix-hairpin-helix domain-containing protein [Microbacterium sp. NPDC079995]|uniref:ComEA family DNA-binding protein n=1 Tax=unclassified Microbacterium TaxID=2609290 RepID=UPI00344E322D